jgi:hypothetical protein
MYPMARPLRIQLAGGVYHVTSRGDEREAIYLSDDDRDSRLISSFLLPGKAGTIPYTSNSPATVRRLS